MSRAPLTWDRLPLFASDEDIGEALLGRDRRHEFHGLAALHESRGMPEANPVWGGRYTPAVKAYFDLAHGLSAAVPLAPDGVEGRFDDDKRRAPRRAIGEDWIIKIKPTKTEDTTGVAISFDLSVCPMVMEEFAALAGVSLNEVRRDLLPASGPLIINHCTSLPYLSNAFHKGWRKDYELAGIPKEVWNRDTRAGGVTEGTKAGASKDDRRRLAGHAREETTDIYDREQLEVHRRVMAARKGWREENGS